jgi:alpha-tubulin suppressor-like RCC1 family protein
LGGQFIRGTQAATVSYSSPVAVIGNHSFVDVTSGARNSYGIKADGTAWAWGNNNNGALGTGDITSYSSPVQVVGAHSFLIIRGGGVTGSAFAVGLKRDGTVWCWGRNNFGELGNNSVTNVSSPVAVVGNHSFIDIAPGFESVFALKADGKVWSWGYNLFGELGDNSQTDKSSPVAVVGNHSFVSIEASVTQTCAGLKSNGTVWCWGYGTGGGIGNNTVVSYSSPVQVVGSHSFCQIRGSAGACFFGLKSDGRLWAWGDNNYGRLGDGSITNRSSPVAVIGSHSFLTLHTGLDISLAVGETWKKKPIVWVAKTAAWEKVVNIATAVSAAFKHPARECR